MKLFNNIILCFKNPLNSFRIYWYNYGGCKALIKSAYFWLSLIVSIVITVINCIFSLYKWDWYQDVISVIPSILGFSLSGYAFLVGFGDKKFMSIIRGKETAKSKSVYMEVNAAFIHFIFIQFLCLGTSIIFKALHVEKIILPYFIGCFLFFYALFSIVATAFCILNLADWFDAMVPPDDKK